MVHITYASPRQVVFGLDHVKSMRSAVSPPCRPWHFHAEPSFVLGTSVLFATRCPPVSGGPAERQSTDLAEGG